MKLPDNFEWPEPPPGKVFCAQCKHYRWVGYCASNPGDSWRARRERYADPSKKNANNDCGEFEKYVEPPKPPPSRIVTEWDESCDAPWWKF